MRKKHIILMIMIHWSFGLVLFAQTVKYVRTIQFENEARNEKVKSFLFGKKQKKPINPGSVCRISHDLLCITDSTNSTILIIDNSGNVKKRITRLKKIKVISPVCACIDDKKNLYISDSALRVVLKLDKKFILSDVFFSDSQSRITGIVFRKGMFYCVDTQNHRLICLNREGVPKVVFGKRGSSVGEFNFPTHIAVDDEFLYVTDAMNFRIQIFTHSGEFIRTFGTVGRGGGNFSKPKGLAVDGKKRVFVVDAMFDNVQIFNFKGEFLYYFGGPGRERGEFWMPLDVMIDNDNLIWVADTYNHRLQLFRLIFPEGIQ